MSQNQGCQVGCRICPFTGLHPKIMNKPKFDQLVLFRISQNIEILKEIRQKVFKRC
jgi:hypothetical protein